MTWEKFRRKVLPEALKIEYLVGYERQPFGAIVTAQDYAAPPIINGTPSGTGIRSRGMCTKAGHTRRTGTSPKTHM